MTKQKHGKKRKQPQTPNVRLNPSEQISPEPKLLSIRRSKSRHLIWILPALIVINLVIYSQVRHHDFTNWDDPAYVTQNPVVSQGLNWHGVRWAFTTGREANWHPLTWLSHMLDVQIFGMTPGPHHLVSLLFHIANTLLLFWILFRMTGAIGKSAFVAGLFAAHPLHVESVAWIAERKDVLSTFFLMLAIWAYFAYVRKPDYGRYLLLAALFAFALMSKPMAITLPFILFLLDIWPLGRLRLESGQKPVWLQLFREKIPLIVLAITSSIVTIIVQWHGGSVVKIDAHPLSSRIANALFSYIAYLSNMLWPAGLSAFYPYKTVHFLWIVVCLAILAGISVLAIRYSARHPFFLVGWIWYLVTLVPVIGLIQVGAQARADRYTYIPLIGIFIIIAWGIPGILSRLRNSNIPLAIAAGVVICILALAARNQAACWVNGVALWEHALKSSPENHFAHLNAGYELNERGEVSKAMQHYAQALRLYPSFAEAHNALGVALIKQGHANEAVEHFVQAVRIKPDYADAHCNLGARLADLGKIDEAITHLSTALKLDPENAQIHYDLGVALVKQGKNDEAIAQFSEAIQFKPGFVEAYRWWGNALSNQGKFDAAITQYNEALRLKPDFADARNDLGIALDGKGQFDEAIAQYHEALRLKPDLIEAYNGLGIALLKQNKPDEALAQFNKALRIAPNSAEIHRNLGVILVNQGDLNGAIAHYQEALRIKPDLAEAHVSLGDAFLFLRRNKEAIVQYQEALRIKPYYIEARFKLGIASMNQDLFNEAINQFTEILQARPDIIDAHRLLGIALISAGREKEAIPHFNEVLRVSPGDKAANNGLKMALEITKKKSQHTAD